MHYRIPDGKKLHHGKVSIRDYKVKRCIEENTSLIVHYRDEQMTLTPRQLTTYETDGRIYPSKFGGGYYALYDYQFIPDNVIE